MTRSPELHPGQSGTPGVPEEVEAGIPAPAGSMAPEATDVISVLEETVDISKRRVTTGTVRVSTRTVTSAQVAEVALDRSTVDVTRVPVGRVVEVVPDMRVEGNTTIVPVVEERLVVVKQLVLVEEVHIRRRVEQEIAQEPVSLRRQHVVIERFDREGRLIDDSRRSAG